MPTRRKRVKLKVRDEPEQIPSANIINIPEANQCRWIYGEVIEPDAHWCREATDGASYCYRHIGLVYQPRGSSQE